MPRLALSLSMVLFASCGAVPPPRDQGGDGPWAERGDIPRIAVPIEGAPARGAEEPLVTLVVFSDFECPHCRDAAPALDHLVASHPGSVRLVFRHLPLPFHEHAALAAEAAEEARAQGGDDAFWRYHDRLVAGSLGPSELVRHAEAIGLDARRFEIALRGRVHRDRIESDLELADSLGVDGTPTLFLNGRPLLGVPPAPELEAVVGEEIGLAREALARGIARESLYERAMADARRLARTERREAPRPREEPPREEEPLPENQRAQVPVPPDAPRRGAARPALVIQVFSDFECPFCGRVQPTLARLLEEHPDVQLVFRHYPLPFHADARPAATAAIEVHRQLGDEAFWAFHDLLFEDPRALGREALIARAVQVGADGDRVAAALDGGRHAQIIDADIAAVANAGLRIGTPAFLIGERLLMGAQPYEAFDRAVREEQGTVIDTPDGPP